MYIWDCRTNKSVGNIFGPSVSGDGVDFKNDKLLTCSHRNKEQV